VGLANGKEIQSASSYRVTVSWERRKLDWVRWRLDRKSSYWIWKRACVAPNETPLRLRLRERGKWSVTKISDHEGVGLGREMRSQVAQ